MTADEAMRYVRRACNMRQAARDANTYEERLIAAIGGRPPVVRSDDVKAFLSRFCVMPFYAFYRRIYTDGRLWVVYWDNGLMTASKAMDAKNVALEDVVGYYDNRVSIKDLMGDMVAEVYDKTGESLI